MVYHVSLNFVRYLAVYKKHYPPALMDEVWRLEKIGKDGAFHKRLSNDNINTVKDFLTLLYTDPARLRNVWIHLFSTVSCLAVYSSSFIKFLVYFAKVSISILDPCAQTHCIVTFTTSIFPAYDHLESCFALI